MTSGRDTIARGLIGRLVQETGIPDPANAIRSRAIQVIDSFVSHFGEPETWPLNLELVASFLGIKFGGTAPSFSSDAELVPIASGNVEIRINPDRPETRIRFSIGHEITHTFFPEYASHVWPRADARYRNLENADDYLEMLCDIGAAELVLPRRWFIPDIQGVVRAEDIISLADKYGASRHATVRRFAELHPQDLASVFFSWKLKPKQKGVIGNRSQLNLFGTSPEEEIKEAVRLRIDYVIPSVLFANAGYYLPRDKSIESVGPIYEAAATGIPCEGEHHLELGEAAGTYSIMAIPLWTPIENLGPLGESAVVAILRPLKLSRSVRRSEIRTAATPLFR